MAGNEDVLERIRQVVRVLGDDPSGQSLVKDVLRRVGDYVTAVNRLEVELLVGGEGAEYRQEIEELDRRRSQGHDALIDAINICCRYLMKQYPDRVPPGGVYPEPGHLINRNRRAIGDWAGAVVAGLFASRR